MAKSGTGVHQVPMSHYLEKLEHQFLVAWIALGGRHFQGSMQVSYIVLAVTPVDRQNTKP